MKKKLEFYPAKKEILESILESNERKIFNFLNLYSVYLFSKNKNFKKSILENRNNNINFIDGSTVSIYLKAKKIRGTDFTKYFFENFKNNNNLKHFFIGFEKKDIEIFRKKFPEIKKSKLFAYNPPYIKTEDFPKEEISKICKLIKDSKANCVWIGVGNPKQEILSQDIFKETNSKYFFNVGAAFDFLTGKKKEAPKFFKELRIEWLYRGIFDFKHSRKKIFGSFIGLFYLPKLVRLAK